MPTDHDETEGALREAFVSYVAGKQDGTTLDIDVSLLEDSLSKTPWERMLANDDALNFAESLRAAMEKRHAKP